MLTHPTQALLLSTWCLLTAPAIAEETVWIGGDAIQRQLDVEGQLQTTFLRNRLSGKNAKIENPEEFAITVQIEGKESEQRFTTRDFTVGEVKSSDDSLSVSLSSDSAPFDLVVRYQSTKGEPWIRKQLQLVARKPLTVRGAEVENLPITDAYEPYEADQLTAQGRAKWRPPLGQPVYTKGTALWGGMEFPGARNHIIHGKVVFRHLTNATLAAGESWTSHQAAIGAADEAAFVQDAFYDYIDRTRARPLRLQVQYNSWFDYKRDVTKESFIKSVNKVSHELNEKRGVPPLRAYVIDDGWQAARKTDWTKTGVWPQNEKFDKNFTSSRKAIKDAGSELGLWLSPACGFGGTFAIPPMRKAGWRALDTFMSLTGEDYMADLERRMVELAASNVDYFKLDGIFGHVNFRNFDIDGFGGGEEELNKNKYDNAKERYVALGSERLMTIFGKMAEKNPDLYIVISNGAYLSPWWLHHVDAIWMINAGDAAGGADRTEELVYRDKVYYQLAAEERDNTQYPLHSIFNHEPKKKKTGEPADTFRRYLYMNLSRGTGFVELYLVTFNLSDSDWDVLAEGLKWVHKVFPNFKRARMFGGDPGQGKAYGYTGWVDKTGYLSLHNPSDREQVVEVTLDREFGLPKKAIDGKLTYTLTSPLEGDADGLESSYTAGSTFQMTLPAKAIRIYEFSAE